MDRRVAASCQTDVRSPRSLSRLRRVLVPPSREPRAPTARVPSAERRRLVDECANLLGARDCEDELHLVQLSASLGDGGWHPRLGDLRLADSTKALAEQRLDRLDPRAVIGDRDLLTEALAALGAGAGRPRLPLVLVAASSRTRRIVSTSSAAVSASAGRTADGELARRGLSSSGSDSAITGSRCRAFRLFVWSPLATVSYRARCEAA